jgi:hypothetical protein
MKILLRGAFALLLLLTVTGQIKALQPDHSLVDTPESLAAPLARLGLAVTGPDADGVLHAVAPDCPSPVRIGLFLLSGAQDTDVAAMLRPGTTPRYVYLGLVSQRSDRWPMYTRWLRASAAAMIGLRQDHAPKRMVLAALPDACPGLAKLDWAALSP